MLKYRAVTPPAFNKSVGPSQAAVCTGHPRKAHHQARGDAGQLDILCQLDPEDHSFMHCSLLLPQQFFPALVSSADTSPTGGLSNCHSPSPISAMATTISVALRETPVPGHLPHPHPQALSLASSLLAHSLSISYWTMTATPFQLHSLSLLPPHSGPPFK